MPIKQLFLNSKKLIDHNIMKMKWRIMPHIQHKKREQYLLDAKTKPAADQPKNSELVAQTLVTTACSKN